MSHVAVRENYAGWGCVRPFFKYDSLKSINKNVSGNLFVSNEKFIFLNQLWYMMAVVKNTCCNYYTEILI